MNLRRNPRHPLIAAAIAAAAFLLSVGYSSASNAAGPRLLNQSPEPCDATAAERVIWDLDGAAASDDPFAPNIRVKAARRRRQPGEPMHFYFFCTTCRLVESDPGGPSNWRDVFRDAFLGIRCRSCGNQSLKNTNFTIVEHVGQRGEPSKWQPYLSGPWERRSWRTMLNTRYNYYCSCGYDSTTALSAGPMEFCRYDIRKLRETKDITMDCLVPEITVAAGGNPETLRLTGGNRKLPPGAFDGLTNLEWLDLSDNPGVGFTITHPNAGLYLYWRGVVRQ